jgi:hypothetical protein
MWKYESNVLEFKPVTDSVYVEFALQIIAFNSSDKYKTLLCLTSYRNLILSTLWWKPP